MQIGKLPNDLLNKLILEPIRRDCSCRSEVVLRPSIGEDCSVLDFKEDYILVSTDPITATEKEIGKLLLTVCSNDIAAAGGEPVGILVTALIPPSCTEKKIETVMSELVCEAKKLNIDVIGGHTEITDAVNRIILTGTILGRISRQTLVTTGGAKEGDKIIMTKSAAIEGTAILAQEYEQELIYKFGREFVQRASSLSNCLSVIKEAKIGVKNGVSSMHDITEGGLIGAVYEASVASNCAYNIDLRKVPVKDETTKICAYFGINAFELVSSGSMLMCTNDAEKLINDLKAAGIDAAVIGEVKQGSCEITDLSGKKSALTPPLTDAIYLVKKQKEIIFVCTGNTCRSPMAEGIAKKLSEDYIFLSRGVSANEGDCVSENALLSMQKKGIDISASIPTNISNKDIALADLILTMTSSHKQYLIRRFPTAESKIFTLYEYCLDDPGRDVSDPFGQDLNKYNLCAEELEDCIKSLIDRLVSS